MGGLGVVGVVGCKRWTKGRVSLWVGMFCVYRGESTPTPLTPPHTHQPKTDAFSSSDVSDPSHPPPHTNTHKNAASSSAASSDSDSDEEGEGEAEASMLRDHGSVPQEEALALADAAWRQLMDGGKGDYEAYNACVETLRGVAHALLGGLVCICVCVGVCRYMFVLCVSVCAAVSVVLVC